MRIAADLPPASHCPGRDLRRRLAVALVSGAALLCAGAVAAEDHLAGPVAAEVIRAVDGDTLEVKARIWLGLEVTTKIRIRGIDAPEVHGKCQREKDMAAAATARLAELAGAGTVALSDIADDKYFGRVIADVASPAGGDLKTAMLSSGLARSYDGGTRGQWCDLASIGGG
jgi:micrococcal nuclease